MALTTDAYFLFDYRDSVYANLLAEALKREKFVVECKNFTPNDAACLSELEYELSRCRYAVVIFSNHFIFNGDIVTLSKLDALMNKEILTKKKVVLPIHHNISSVEMTKVMPIMAAKMALNSSIHSVDFFIKAFKDVINKAQKVKV
jgi:hypothetical protein